jgi:hypothetical protein
VQPIVNDLDLFVDYLPGKAVDRHMHPAMLLPFDYEVILKTVRSGLEVTGLCDRIDKEIPSPGFALLPRARERRSRVNALAEMPVIWKYGYP